ncbi:hypothetical protein MACJ_003291 [Theileria orientalis]|uniref:Uncharacterized protein n=1 Tax=Theileria orientalis TaxID=68886 RepID=A0A976QS24_THEOR|nr:hypothetical protein MACJ_003291 [Theileria orientalis]
MDSSDNALGENEPTPEASPSELNNFVNSHENTSDLKESTEIDYSKIQDIEFGSKSFVYTRRLWFPDSLTSFGDTANAARRGSDDTIHVNLDIPNEENEVSLNFDKDTETVFDVSVEASVQMVQDSLFYDSIS